MQQLANLFTPIERPVITARNAKEDLANQIAARTTANAKVLAKRIVIWANRYKLTETDLHALLKKADDPTIRNFTAFCQWSIKDAPKHQSQISATELGDSQASA